MNIYWDFLSSVILLFWEHKDRSGMLVCPHHGFTVLSVSTSSEFLAQFTILYYAFPKKNVEFQHADTQTKSDCVRNKLWPIYEHITK